MAARGIRAVRLNRAYILGARAMSEKRPPNRLADGGLRLASGRYLLDRAVESIWKKQAIRAGLTQNSSDVLFDERFDLSVRR
jgi:hypothetical protein